jgi:hypothetical protein
MERFAVAGISADFPARFGLASYIKKMGWQEWFARREARRARKRQQARQRREAQRLARQTEVWLEQWLRNSVMTRELGNDVVAFARLTVVADPSPSTPARRPGGRGLLHVKRSERLRFRPRWLIARCPSQ